MTESVELELGIEECYPDYAGDREPEIPAPDERDETDEMIISLTIDEKKHEFLREQAEERLNVKNIERAERLLWIDEAEVYSCCEGHYFEKREGEWTGFTTHSDR